MRKIRLIAADMDGTLLNKQLEISPRNAAAIKAAQQKGVLFSVCSGRFCQFGAMKTKEAGISCPVVGANGASIWDDKVNRIVETFPLPADTAKTVNALLRSYDIYYCVFAPDMITVSREGTTHLKSFWNHPSLTEGYDLRFSSSAEDARKAAEEGKALKFYVGRLPDDVYQKVTDDLSQLNGIYVTTSGRNCIEIMNEGVNKCSGVQRLAAMHGIRMDEVMTLGDYFNDVPMIKAAGLGVAMGNSHEDVKACADYVTDTNEEDGVAKAIEKFVL